MATNTKASSNNTSPPTNRDERGAGSASPQDSGAPSFADLPVATVTDAIPHLRRPFAANAVRWKVQTGKAGSPGGYVVAYIDARLVIERLNRVCPHMWSTEYEPWGGRWDSGLMICHLTVGDVTRTDVGKGQGEDKEKAAFSDALKRAAVHFGVGVSLYAMKAVWVRKTPSGELLSDGTPTLRADDKGRPTMTPQVEAYLRDMYQRWLDGRGGKMFGPALDHGDEEGSAGHLLDGSAPDLADEQAGDDAAALAVKREELEKAYEGLPGAARKKLPKGRFNAWLRDSGTLEELAQVEAKLAELRGGADAGE